MKTRTLWIRWLREGHGWLGLWGAVLGLIFGVSGIWLNHRSVLPLSVAQQRSTVQLALPDPAPDDAAALATWLQGALRLDAPATSVKVEPARPVPWSTPSNRLQQPEQWTIRFGGPGATVQVEAWAGNRSVSVRRVDSGLLGTLMNMHKGVGMPLAWILLVDTLGGSLIVLCLSGLALWVLMHRRRLLLGVVIFGGACAVTGGVVLASW